MANSYSGFLLTLAAAVDDAQKALVAPNNLIKTVKKDLRPTPAAQYSSVNVNIPSSTFTVTNLTSGSLTVSDVTSTPVVVSLDKHPSTGFDLPDYDTMRMMDAQMARDLFVDEAIKRMLEAINGYIAALITAGNFSQVVTGGSADVMTYAEFLEAWETLATAKVPIRDAPNMHLMMHPKVFRYTFAQDDFIKASSVGDQIATLNRTTGAFARTMGIQPEYDLDMPLAAGVYTSLIYHRDAMVLVARSMQAENALGVEQVIAFYDGIPIRISIGYNQLAFKKVITFDALCGVKVIRGTFGCRHTST